ncbi:MAG TPA: tetratricopeptide repeat protein [Phycisphaerae bacterium]
MQTPLAESLRTYYEAQNHLRRGICLLNAGAFEQAAREFGAAYEINPQHMPLPRFLAASWAGARRDHDPTTSIGPNTLSDGRDASAIRDALLLWKSGQTQAAIVALRAAVRQQPECAELHFQLGTLLAAIDEYEEAELRFTQAVSIDRKHTDALVSLAMCRALQARTQDAIACLRRAQRQEPHDARIALLLSQALQSAGRDSGFSPVLAMMPADDPTADEQALDELSRIIELEPDFADALLSLPGEPDDTPVHEMCVMLAATLQRALARQPEHADLHYHCGRVLARLGRADEAIAATERAVAINPRFVQALIQLAQLYQQTDRLTDATTRLEQALAHGGEYADVYYQLGNLYRRAGQIQRARGAYVRALRINERYGAARSALEALA